MHLGKTTELFIRDNMEKQLSVSHTDLKDLDIARYELKLRTMQDTVLPNFLGSTLRGAFGHSLKLAVCVMNHRDCDKCLVANSCIYPYPFETPVPLTLPQLRGQNKAPHPFILSPPDQSLQPDNKRRALSIDEELVFQLLLMGRTIDYLPYVVYAVSEMAERGLGVNRAPFQLTEVAAVYFNGRTEAIYKGERQKLSLPRRPKINLGEAIRERMATLSESNSVRLRFVTPARIRVDGDLQSALNFPLLVRNLLRRVSLLCAIHGQAELVLDYCGIIDEANSIEMKDAQLQWWDLERYSNRQKTKVKIGGFIGEIEYAGDDIDRFLPLIVAGEILHIGAGTTFGLGKYQIVS